MTDLRTAAQQALEAMEYSGMDVGKFNRINAACRALKAALAEPVQEPVRELLISAAAIAVAAYRKGAYQGASWVADAVLEPAPPKRKPPATIDEMFARMDKAPRGVFAGHDPMTIWMDAWRAAEQHHGIKEGT